MSEPLVLQQYGPAQEIELDHGQMQALRAAAGSALTISPGSWPDSWSLRTGSLVGTVVTPEVRVLIRPKVTNANLFHLLEPSTGALAFGPEAFGYEETDDLMVAVAIFYLRHLERALARGIERRYIEQEGAIVGVRGRVDAGRVARRAGLPLPVDCRYDEYSADTQLNRLLAGGAERASRWPYVSPSVRSGLRRCLALLEETGPVRPTDIDRPTILTRLNDHCRRVERLARIVIAGASLNDGVGRAGASAFLIDMNRVFELFVEDRLRRFLSGRAQVVSQAHTVLDRDRRIRMRPDLVIRRTGRPIYVADSKYKLTATGDGREADYYQLLAYCTALGLPEGMLIYCQHDGDVPPRLATVVGAGAERLATTAMQLDGSPADIDRRFRALAEDLLARAL